MIGGKQVIHVSVFLFLFFCCCCFREVSSDHLLKNDPSLHIIDTVNQGASCPDPIKNLKTKIKGF